MVKTLEKRSNDAEGMVVEVQRALAEARASIGALEIDLKETKEKAAAAESRATLAEAEVEHVRIAVEGERDMVVTTLEAGLKEAEDALQQARLQILREGKAQNEASVAKEHAGLPAFERHLPLLSLKHVQKSPPRSLPQKKPSSRPLVRQRKRR